MKCIVGKKLGMTQVFRPDGTVIPVTRVQAGPCVVTQVKTKDHDGVMAVQLGFGSQAVFRIRKPQQGHTQGLSLGKTGTAPQHMREFRISTEEGDKLKRGDTITVAMFAPGERIQVTGEAKGKGFQGVVKRHKFAGGPATHGHKDNLRMPGSIGATGPQRVFKGMRMAGRMGGGQVTVKNLEVMVVDPDTNEILIKGAIPGSFGGLVCIASPEGEITVVTQEIPAEKQDEQAPPENATPETTPTVEQTA